MNKKFLSRLQSVYKVQTIPNLGSSCRGSSVKLEVSILMVSYVGTYKGVQLNHKTPIHWNLIGSSMTAPLPMISPSSILLSPLYHCTFIPTRKHLAHVKKCDYFSFFLICKKCISKKLRNLKLCKSAMSVVVTDHIPNVCLFFTNSNSVILTHLSQVSAHLGNYLGSTQAITTFIQNQRIDKIMSLS
jgi:hypothetical protein